MPPLRLTNAISEEFECEPVIVPPGLKKEDYSLIRPCNRYSELYKSCKSISGRINQYYVYGEKLDCEAHNRNYNNCLSYRKTKDISHLNSIIEWEKNLINTRLKCVEQNNCWEYRNEPPEAFDKPLPEFIAKRQTDSLFSAASNNKWVNLTIEFL